MHADERHDRMKNIAKLWAAAFLAGILGAVAMFTFHALISASEWLLSRQTGGLVHEALYLPGWARLLVPPCGGILAGLILQAGERWIAGRPHVDYIDAAREGKIALNDRSNAVRMISSLFSIGSGASIGREGPMVQLSAWASSWLARVFPIAEAERNAILVCGIASGIAAAYHAPIAGVVFVLELALGYFSRNTLAPLLISAVTASALIFWMVEPTPLYVMPAVPKAPVTPQSLLIALGVGAAAGVLGLVLLKFIEWTRLAFAHVKPLWLRLGLGGLVVGLLSIGVPEVWGNGYAVVSTVLDGGLDWKWVAIVLAAKFVATVASTSSGAIGGIFTPTLFVGATSGYLLGTFLTYPGMVDSPIQMAVIGMAAVLAAVTHAPLMAIVMVLEMTNQFQLALPVMLACGTAYAVSAQFGVKPLYGNPIEHHA